MTWPEEMDDDRQGEMNGFFKAYHLQVLKKLDDRELHRVGLCKTNEERLASVYALPYVHDVTVEPRFKGKSQTTAKQRRLEGNQAFKVKNYALALELYSQCVLNAPAEGDDEELALGLANRSAVLYHLKNYAAALTDIRMALQCGYPADMRCKLYERMARCLLLSDSNPGEVEQTCAEALKAAKNSQLMDQKKLEQFQKDVQDILEQTKRKVSSNTKTEVMTMDPEVPEVTGGRNAKLPNASVFLQIAEDQDSGRFAVAAKNIAAGDVVVVEKPTASVIQARKYQSHCHHCFKALAVPYPCPRCSGIAFCSTQCRDTALKTYHGIECPLIDLLYDAGISITCYLALRMITQHPIEFFHQVRPFVENGNSPQDETMKKYVDTCKLVTHEGRRDPSSFFHLSLMAVFLLKCLKLASYFPQNDPAASDLSPDEKYIGALLLRHMQLLQFNAHEVAELEMRKQNSMEDAKSVYLGAAVYPTVALFNHSCDPGIVRYFQGDTMIVRAIKPIRRGEMIAENYGPIFTQIPKEKRQKTLKQRYWFDCCCDACVYQWPLYSGMNNQSLRFRCSTPGCKFAIDVSIETMNPFVKCARCKSVINILKGLQTLQTTEESFHQGMASLESGKFQEALRIFLRTLKDLDDVLSPPYRDYNLCQEAARKCMLSLGNVRVVSAEN